MRVQFTSGCTWYELSFAEGDIAELDTAIAERLMRAGVVTPAPLPVEKEVKTEEENGDNDITTPEDSGGGEPLNDGGSKNPPKRRTNRRN